MIDVCFLLEGTYPYVAGGVSTWVHQLIGAMGDMRVAIVHIAAHADPTRTLKYEIPSHVVSFKEIFLHDYALARTRSRNPSSDDYDLVKTVYQDLSAHRFDSLSEILPLFQGESDCFDLPSFFASREVWEMLLEGYEKHAPHISFLDFFWTWRGIHMPLIHLLRQDLPKAKIYHSISTGYAGLLASLAKMKYGQKMFLTEHGIYTHERMLEISQSTWIYEQATRHYRAEREMSFFKKWWVQLFKVMSGIAYHHADRIYTLYEGNRTRQILEGASPEKISIIPNGIHVPRQDPPKRTKKSPPQIGFVGRVVSIKDVKTFIHAARIVLEDHPQSEFYIIGPTDEEVDYYEECVALVSALGLNGKVHFTGRVSVTEYYSFLDVIVLTSLSEAQPYVILEANLAGIPVVSTRVGACQEMLLGSTAEDRALGASGLITEVSSPRETAKAISLLLQNPRLYESMGEAGRRRVQTYYDQDDLLSRYLNVYEQNL